MTLYNTQNAVGSADPRDLYDNSIVIDEFANSSDETATDRLGQVRKTIRGIVVAANNAITQAGYQFKGDYAAGIEIVAYNEVVRDSNGEFWRVAGTEDLPYITTGAGLPEGGVMMPVGDATLRQELADPAQGGDAVQVTTTTGEQTLTDALDARANIGGFVGGSFEYGEDAPEDKSTTPSGPTIRRQIVTTEDLNIFVDASVGTSGDGSQGSPLKSINEALSLVPREIYHKVRIYLADGNYTGPENEWNLYNYFVTPRSSAGFKIIGHTPDNPLYSTLDRTAVVIGDESVNPGGNSNFVIGGVLGDADDVHFAGVTFDGRVQPYGTPFAFFDCIFKNGRSDVCVDGHSARVKFVRCHFQDVVRPVNSQDLAMMFLTDCTASNITEPCGARNGSFVSFETSPDFETEPTSPPSYEGNSSIKFDGKHYHVRGSSSQMFAIGDLDEDHFSINTNRSIAGQGGFIGGAVTEQDPGSNRFALYMDSATGHINVRINLNGVTETVRVATFPT